MFDIDALKNKIAVIGDGNTPYGNFLDIDDYGRRTSQSCAEAQGLRSGCHLSGAGPS